MEKYKSPFFGTEGLTSTSANHIANIAKEYYQSLEAELEATNFVKTVESHQHRKIACLEEIAYLNGWIAKDDVLAVYEELKKNQYGQYLKDVLDGKYLDVLH